MRSFSSSTPEILSVTGSLFETLVRWHCVSFDPSLRGFNVRPDRADWSHYCRLWTAL